MKLHHKLELVGAACVLLGLFLQFFIASSVEEDMKETDAYELEMRLEHIYYLVKTGRETNPSWDQISSFAKGPRIEGDSHWQFQEVYYFATPAAIIFFITGSLLGLLGRFIEVSKENA